MKLQINSLHVSLAGQKILQNINLHVKAKQFVAILGPNGSGKSTLLKTVYRVLKPEKGEIILNDHNIKTYKSRRIAQAMSVVSQFQLYAFNFTVEEIVMTARTPHLSYLQREREIDREIVHEALRKTGLYEMRHYNITNLSGGEKQRLTLARAIAQQANFMILDEPSNHLDIKYQMEVLSTIKEMNISVLTALHDLPLAAKYCDYIYFIKNGQIAYHGTTQEVLTKDTIRDVYEVECEIFHHPLTNNICISYY